MSAEHFVRAQNDVLRRYGVAADSKFVDIQICNGRAHVLVTGEGPPVIMFNGIGIPAAMFVPLIAKLHGFKIYAVDLPGFGLTEVTSDFTNDLRSNAVVFVQEVLDALNLSQAMFVGNSLGSLWISWAALDRPDMITAIAHLGCPAFLLDTSAPLPMRMLSVPFLGRLMMKVQPPSTKQVEQLSKMVNEYPLQPEIVELIVETEKLPGFQSMFLPTLHALVNPLGSRAHMRMTEEQLSQISQPVLFIWGENDPFGPVDTGQRAVEIMQNASLQVVKGGHSPWLQSADQAGQLVAEFLKSHGDTAPIESA